MSSKQGTKRIIFAAAFLLCSTHAATPIKAWTNANIETYEVLITEQSDHDDVGVELGLRVNAGWVRSIEIPAIGKATRKAITFVDQQSGERFPADFDEDGVTLNFRKSPKKGFYRAHYSLTRSANSRGQLGLAGWAAPIERLRISLIAMDEKLSPSADDPSVTMNEVGQDAQYWSNFRGLEEEAHRLPKGSLSWERFSLPPHTPIHITWRAHTSKHSPTSNIEDATVAESEVQSSSARSTLQPKTSRSENTTQHFTAKLKNQPPTLWVILLGLLCALIGVNTRKEDSFASKSIRSLSLLACMGAMLEPSPGFAYAALTIALIASFPFGKSRNTMLQQKIVQHGSYLIIALALVTALLTKSDTLLLHSIFLAAIIRIAFSNPQPQTKKSGAFSTEP